MEVSPKCGERSPTGKSVGVLEVEKEDIEEPIPGQRETKKESPGRRDCEQGERLLVRIEKTEKMMLRFVDKIEIQLLGLEKKRKQPAMKRSSGTLEHSRALCLQGQRPLRLPECWRGWRLGRRPGWGISLEIYSGERKDAKVAATVSALAGRLVLISLVLSVAEADVATVDGLESTTKSAHDRKRWKLVVV
ncbi:hypothetical protein B296_00051151 [Ensete ventricosum]|uniref:Uncharacterized protein n=1 Tax=Ensete ventricosum TaxID=4639 RepID=A0A426X006_ENSVE|nr:hypothetical protein B296_00051151 [Ensete ventricosum]